MSPGPHLVHVHPAHGRVQTEEMLESYFSFLNIGFVIIVATTVARIIGMMPDTISGKNFSGKRYMNIDIVLPTCKKIIRCYFFIMRSTDLHHRQVKKVT